jgi:hypothetical protein
MSPIYLKAKDFDTEHTRFASKYNLYLYRENGVDEDYPVCYLFCWHDNRVDFGTDNRAKMMRRARLPLATFPQLEEG